MLCVSSPSSHTNAVTKNQLAVAYSSGGRKSLKTLTGPSRFEVEEDCQGLDCVKRLHPVFFVHFRFDGGECRLDEVVQRVKIKIYQVVQPFIISIRRRKEAIVSSPLWIYMSWKSGLRRSDFSRRSSTISFAFVETKISGLRKVYPGGMTYP